MTTYYVGIGGNDANNGTTWALRKLTLNGAENIPVAATDIVYVGPGVYRELLTVDVSGAAGAGNTITYIGDVTGEHTDSVGGIVRITGSDNDQTAARADCITATTKTYRTFQGFMFDTCSSHEINAVTGCTNWIIQDCYFESTVGHCIHITGLAQSTNTIRRCVFRPSPSLNAINFSHSAVVDGAGHTVENCIVIGGYSGITSVRVGGITVKNCTFVGRGGYGVLVETAITVGQTVVVNNCIFSGLGKGCQGTVAGEIIENYNTFSYNMTDRTNTDVGANSVAYATILTPPVLLDNFRFPWFFGELSKWSTLGRIAGTGMSTDDLFGLPRPTTDSKKSWGAIQYTGKARSTVQAQAGTQSLILPDAGEQFILRVPTTAVDTTITMYVYREADYAGTNPTMIIRQPGVAERVTTDAGAAEDWNQLSDNFTPAALPPYVDIFAVSYNTAVADDYKAYFDTVAVS